MYKQSPNCKRQRDQGISLDRPPPALPARPYHVQDVEVPPAFSPEAGVGVRQLLQQRGAGDDEGREQRVEAVLQRRALRHAPESASPNPVSRPPARPGPPRLVSPHLRGGGGGRPQPAEEGGIGPVEEQLGRGAGDQHAPHSPARPRDHATPPAPRRFLLRRA